MSSLEEQFAALQQQVAELTAVITKRSRRVRLVKLNPDEILRIEHLMGQEGRCVLTMNGEQRIRVWTQVGYASAVNRARALGQAGHGGPSPSTPVTTDEASLVL